jgi:DNA-binding transcriptional regulator YhcF (GntR family)
MTPSVPTVDDVYANLLERIGSGSIEVGSRLPSCRTLADEIGSNPSTVNRAIQRLARHGLVRTEPRRGTYLVNAGAAPAMNPGEAEKAIRDAVLRARRSGFGAAQIRDLFEGALGLGGRQVGVVGFVECNSFDLDRMSTLIENATGVALKPLLLDDLTSDWSDQMNVLATPIFHLADLADLGIDLDRVVELNFVPSSVALRKLATIDHNAVVGVVAPTERGVARMKALVSQYYTGSILAPDQDDPEALVGLDVIVHPAAIDLDSIGVNDLTQKILIDWEIDPGSASTFAGRVASVF